MKSLVAVAVFDTNIVVFADNEQGLVVTLVLLLVMVMTIIKMITIVLINVRLLIHSVSCDSFNFNATS